MSLSPESGKPVSGSNASLDSNTSPSKVADFHNSRVTDSRISTHSFDHTNSLARLGRAEVFNDKNSLSAFKDLHNQQYGHNDSTVQSLPNTSIHENGKTITAAHREFDAAENRDKQQKSNPLSPAWDAVESKPAAKPADAAPKAVPVEGKTGKLSPAWDDVESKPAAKPADAAPKAVPVEGKTGKLSPAWDDVESKPAAKPAAKPTDATSKPAPVEGKSGKLSPAWNAVETKQDNSVVGAGSTFGNNAAADASTSLASNPYPKTTANESVAFVQTDSNKPFTAESRKEIEQVAQLNQTGAGSTFGNNAAADASTSLASNPYPKTTANESVAFVQTDSNKPFTAESRKEIEQVAQLNQTGAGSTFGNNAAADASTSLASNPYPKTTANESVAFVQTDSNKPFTAESRKEIEQVAQLNQTGAGSTFGNNAAADASTSLASNPYPKTTANESVAFVQTDSNKPFTAESRKEIEQVAQLNQTGAGSTFGNNAAADASTSLASNPYPKTTTNESVAFVQTDSNKPFTAESRKEIEQVAQLNQTGAGSTFGNNAAADASTSLASNPYPKTTTNESVAFVQTDSNKPFTAESRKEIEQVAQLNQTGAGSTFGNNAAADASTSLASNPYPKTTTNESVAFVQTDSNKPFTAESRKEIEQVAQLNQTGAGSTFGNNAAADVSTSLASNPYPKTTANESVAFVQTDSNKSQYSVDLNQDKSVTLQSPNEPKQSREERAIASSNDQSTPVATKNTNINKVDVLQQQLARGGSDVGGDAGKIAAAPGSTQQQQQLASAGSDTSKDAGKIQVTPGAVLPGVGTDQQQLIKTLTQAATSTTTDQNAAQVITPLIVQQQQLARTTSDANDAGRMPALPGAALPGDVGKVAAYPGSGQQQQLARATSDANDAGRMPALPGAALPGDVGKVASVPVEAGKLPALPGSGQVARAGGDASGDVGKVAAVPVDAGKLPVLPGSGQLARAGGDASGDVGKVAAIQGKTGEMPVVSGSGQPAKAGGDTSNEAGKVAALPGAGSIQLQQLARIISDIGGDIGKLSALPGSGQVARVGGDASGDAGKVASVPIEAGRLPALPGSGQLTSAGPDTGKEVGLKPTLPGVSASEVPVAPLVQALKGAPAIQPEAQATALTITAAIAKLLNDPNTRIVKDFGQAGEYTTSKLPASIKAGLHPGLIDADIEINKGIKIGEQIGEDEQDITDSKTKKPKTDAINAPIEDFDGTLITRKGKTIDSQDIDEDNLVTSSPAGGALAGLVAPLSDPNDPNQNATATGASSTTDPNQTNIDPANTDPGVALPVNLSEAVLIGMGVLNPMEITGLVEPTKSEQELAAGHQSTEFTPTQRTQDEPGELVKQPSGLADGRTEPSEIAGALATASDAKLQEKPEKSKKDRKDKQDKALADATQSLIDVLLADMDKRKFKDDPDGRIKAQRLDELFGEHKREDYEVKPGDTLGSIAHRKLKERRLAPLIYTVNKKVIGTLAETEITKAKLTSGLVIKLPHFAEILLFRAHKLGDPTPLFVYIHGGASLNHTIEAADNTKRTTYTCRLGNTLTYIAQQHLAESSLWKLIAEINGFSLKTDVNGNPTLKLKRGQVIQLPSRQEIKEFQLLSKQKKSVIDFHPEIKTPAKTKAPKVAVALGNRNQTSTKLRNIHQSRIITQDDLGSGKTTLLLRLEMKLKDAWTTVAEYMVDEKSSGLNVYDIRGGKKSIPVNLPTRAARELAENDLALNAYKYCEQFLAQAA